MLTLKSAISLKAKRGQRRIKAALFDWQQAYRDVLAECDRSKLREKIAHAENMIGSRLRLLARHPRFTAERRSLGDALRHLRLFRLEEQESADECWE